MAQERQRPGIPAHRGRIRPQRRGRAAHRSRLVGIASGAIGACPGVRHVRRQHENRLTSGGASTDRKDRPPQAIRPRRDHRSGNGQRISRCGAYVGIDTAASHPASGELFAVLLPYEGIILRRLAWDRKEKCFVLRAENPAYPEIRIQEDLTGRILGRLAWVMQKV